MSFSRIKTLVLYAQYTDKLSYFDDWKDAFLKADQFEVTAVNVCIKANIAQVEKVILDFDLIVLLHSVVGDTLEFINGYAEVLKRRKGKLLSFVGNEVNLPGGLIQDKIAWIKSLEADFVGTQLPLEAGQWLYAECPKTTVVALPHALNTVAFIPTIALENRKLDMGIRTDRYPPYLGDNDRNDLLNFITSKRDQYSLALDINLKQRFNRAEWANFLNQCKATVATEAGSLFLERDDRTINKILAYCLVKAGNSRERIKVYNQDSIFHKLRSLAPERVKQYFKKAFGFVNEVEVSYLVEFEEIFDLFFKDYPPHPVYTKAISSRHFDAIGTKTCQLMFPGKFNGILAADVHYIALQKDFSNFDECIRKIRDLDFRRGLVDNAYEHVVSNHTYQHRTSAIAHLLT